jgi:TPR repeat protein
VPQDNEKGLTLIKQAAAQGFVRAAFVLGMSYFYGIFAEGFLGGIFKRIFFCEIFNGGLGKGIAQDKEMALNWIFLAGEKGFKKAVHFIEMHGTNKEEGESRKRGRVMICVNFFSNPLFSPHRPQQHHPSS